MNRLGIFCMYDSDGVVDGYIVCLLQEITKVLGHLSIVCNGKLSADGEKILREFTEDIIVRPNSGFDIGAWKHWIVNNSDTLSNYDELVLFNDSFYGPFYPFSEIFGKMDKEYPDADFWGITVHRQSEDTSKLCPYGYIPEHLQSYFLVIRRRLLHYKDFYEYWANAEDAKTMQEAIIKHEVCFTKYFYDKGFNYAAYCDTRDWEQEHSISTNHYLMSVERLLKFYHCPIIKKKIMLISRFEYLNENYGDGPRKAMEFIKQCTDYNVNLIWQNLLRTQNIYVIKTALGLDYILPADISIADTQSAQRDVAIIAHLYYEDLFEECVEYLCNAPSEISLIVTVSDEGKKNTLTKLFKAVNRECDIRLVSARGRDLSALLVGCADVFKKFKYLCFVHDKKSIRSNESISIGRAFYKLLWDNVLGTRMLISNIIATFEREPRLGLLVPPAPYHGVYKILNFTLKFWSLTCFERTVELAKHLGIPASFVNKSCAPLSIGSVFWCRTEALRKITDKRWVAEDFQPEPMDEDGTISHALERIFPFAAQSEGFYTGWILSNDFARDELENLTQLAIVNQPPGGLFYVFTNFVKRMIPAKYWDYFRPAKRFLEKCIKNLSSVKGKTN